MKKQIALAVAAALIVTGMINWLLLALPFVRENSFWVGYAYANASLLLTAVMGLYGFSHRDYISRFYGLPLFATALRFLPVMLAVDLVWMLFPRIPLGVSLSVGALPLAACLLGLIAAEVGRDEITRIEHMTKGKVTDIRLLQGRVLALLPGAADGALQSRLSRLAEDIRFSDPMSGPETAALESDIQAKCGALEAAVGAGDGTRAAALCEEAIALVARRNDRCKAEKGSVHYGERA